MGTGEISAPQSVQRLQRALHAKAKGSPSFRFYSLCDKVWRADGGGAPQRRCARLADRGVRCGPVAWGLARDLKAGTYRPDAVRQVLIPKFRLGIPCIRDRVAQTAAMLVLSPIFEATWHRSNTPIVRAVAHTSRQARASVAEHRPLVDAASDYFGQIPHAELLKSLARRVSDGRVLGWVKAWLEMAVEEDDARAANAARTGRVAQGHPARVANFPPANIYMRRFIVGWKVLGYAQRRISSTTPTIWWCGKAPSAVDADGVRVATAETDGQCREDPMLPSARGAH